MSASAFVTITAHLCVVAATVLLWGWVAGLFALALLLYVEICVNVLARASQAPRPVSKLYCQHYPGHLAESCDICSGRRRV
jgi:hypothetical protein